MNEENEKLRERLKSTEQKTSAFLEEKSRMREQLEKLQATMRSRGNGGVSPGSDICTGTCFSLTHFHLPHFFVLYNQGDTAELERQLRQLKTDMEKVSIIRDQNHRSHLKAFSKNHFPFAERVILLADGGATGRRTNVGQAPVA